MSDQANQHPKLWGFAGVYSYPELKEGGGDPLVRRIEFTARHGFDVIGIPLWELGTEARQMEVRAALERTGLQTVVNVAYNFFAGTLEESVSEAKRQVELFRGVQPWIRAVLTMTIAPYPYHRFMRGETPLEWQMDRLAKVLPILVEGMGEYGLRFGIENHADYGLGDLIGLCGRVPGLGILLDTGNCFVVREDPIVSCRAAAPFVVGTHFKDHYLVRESGIVFKQTGAVLGEGHVGLETIYNDLIAGNANPEEIVMMFELEHEPDTDQYENLEKSKQFAERISGHRFNAKS